MSFISFLLNQIKVYKNPLFIIILITILSSCTYHKAEIFPVENGPVISYQNDIKPLMAIHCNYCHSATATDPNKAGNTFLDNYTDVKFYALKRSTSNAAYTSLQARIRFIETPGMPFNKAPLAESDIKKIESWIKAGAPNN